MRIHHALRAAADSGVSSTYSDAVMALNPFAYWKMDETSGTTIFDETGNYHGTYINNPSLDQSPLIQSGRSVSFNGTDNYASMGTLGSFGAGLNQFAAAFWISFSGTDGGAAFGLINNNSNNGTLFYCRVNAGYFVTEPGHVWYLLRNNDSNERGRVSARSDLNDGNPHFIVVQKFPGADDADFAIYVDGVLDNGDLRSPSEYAINDFRNFNNSLSLAAITKMDGTRDLFLKGGLDEIALFSGKNLTSSEISDLYSIGTTGTP